MVKTHVTLLILTVLLIGGETVYGQRYRLELAKPKYEIGDCVHEPSIRGDGDIKVLITGKENYQYVNNVYIVKDDTGITLKSLEEKDDFSYIDDKNFTPIHCPAQFMELKEF